MEDKILMEFASWLPKSGVKEFADKSPEECIMLLDKVATSGKEGEEIIKSLFVKFHGSKNSKTSLGEKAGYLKTLRAQKGTKVKADDVVGPDGILRGSVWEVIEDSTDAEGNRTQTILSDL